MHLDNVWFHRFAIVTHRFIAPVVGHPPKLHRARLAAVRDSLT